MKMLLQLCTVAQQKAARRGGGGGGVHMSILEIYSCYGKPVVIMQECEITPKGNREKTEHVGSGSVG